MAGSLRGGSGRLSKAAPAQRLHLCSHRPSAGGTVRQTLTLTLTPTLTRCRRLCTATCTRSHSAAARPYIACSPVDKLGLGSGLGFGFADLALFCSPTPTLNPTPTPTPHRRHARLREGAPVLPLPLTLIAGMLAFEKEHAVMRTKCTDDAVWERYKPVRLGLGLGCGRGSGSDTSRCD